MVDRDGNDSYHIIYSDEINGGIAMSDEKQIKLLVSIGPDASGRQKPDQGNLRLFASRMSDGERMEILEGKPVTLTVEKGGADHMTLLNLESQGFVTIEDPSKAAKEKPPESGKSGKPGSAGA